MRRLLMVGAVLVAFAAMVQPANATVLDLDPNTTTPDSVGVTFFFDCPAGSVDCTNDLSAHLTLTLISISGTDAVFELEIENTTVGVGDVTAVGFQTDPDAIGVGDADGTPLEDPTTDTGGGTDTDVFLNASLVDQLTGNLKLVEICAYTGPNCTGGAGDRLNPQETDIFQITLVAATNWGTSIDVNDGFGIKFQAAPGSFEVPGTEDGPPVDGPPQEGPPVEGPPQEAEPTTLLLLGAGFAMAASRLRRRSA